MMLPESGIIFGTRDCHSGLLIPEASSLFHFHRSCHSAAGKKPWMIRVSRCPVELNFDLVLSLKCCLKFHRQH